MDTKKLRQKILDLAIRGKLVPQDPNDEPASVLLERIRAEKERLIKEGKIKRSKKTTSDTPHYENDVPFEVPDGWISCRFDRICSKFSTGPFGSMVHKADYVSDGGVPIVNPMNIVAGDILNDNLMMVSNEKAQELNRYRLSVDDILIARRGDLKKCAIVKETAVDWLCGTGSFFLHVPYVESRYIQLFYLSEYVQTILSKECVGATMDNLNQSVLGAIPFLLPPQKEQRRIISEVDKWFALIDTLETEKEDLQTFIAQTKSKILDLAIHGKLVPQDQNDEPAIELLKRINPKFTPCDNAHYPFDVPHNWVWAKGVDIFKPMKATSPLGDTFKYIDIDAIDNKRNVVTSVKVLNTKQAPSRASRYTEKGCVLFSMVRPYLRNIAMVTEDDCIASTGFFVCQGKGCLSPKFCYYQMLSNYVVDGLNDFMKGDNSPSITKAQIEEYIFPLPPLNEQKRIVAKIQELFAVLDEIQKSIEA